MKKLLLIFIITASIITGCSKANHHCYRCIDPGQVDQAFDVCNTDTTAAGRAAYNTLASGGHLNNTNGQPDSCMAYDK